MDAFNGFDVFICSHFFVSFLFLFISTSLLLVSTYCQLVP
nr:MAG TPA: hypothetical protein [Caudoviricetes sp.]